MWDAEPESRRGFAEDCVREALREDRHGNAVYVMAIVHGGAMGMPNFIRYDVPKG